MFGIAKHGLEKKETRPYGDDVVHVADLPEMGRSIAKFMDEKFREEARKEGVNAEGLLCPGCFMAAIFNATVELAKANDYPLPKLAYMMADSYIDLMAKTRRGRPSDPILSHDLDD